MIIAIGAQNIHVIRNGIIRNHIFSISITCFLCDFLLMSVGVFFVAGLTSSNKTLTFIISVLSICFLIYYGFCALRKARNGNYVSDGEIQACERSSLKSAILSTLAITLLNPHVYLDTVVIIGGVSSSLSWQEKISFISGALIASLLWFFSLGFFSRFFLRFFTTNKSRIIFDTFVALFMWFLAINIGLYFYKEFFSI